MRGGATEFTVSDALLYVTLSTLIGGERFEGRSIYRAARRAESAEVDQRPEENHLRSGGSNWNRRDHSLDYTGRSQLYVNNLI